MTQTFRIYMPDGVYEVEAEKLTPAAIEAKGILPPPAPKKPLSVSFPVESGES